MLGILQCANKKLLHFVRGCMPSLRYLLLRATGSILAVIIISLVSPMKSYLQKSMDWRKRECVLTLYSPVMILDGRT